MHPLLARQLRKMFRATPPGEEFSPLLAKPVGKGSGQGLSVSRAFVVEHHGGTLTLASEIGKGTTFTIRLPIGGKSALPEAGVA
jgi:nitrogen-specific signal transduction histidine kinase